MITPEQIKAARALLRLEQEELARRSGVSVTTIRRLEAADGEQLVARQTVGTVVKALEEAGVEFIHQGVSLKKARRDKEAQLARLREIAKRAASTASGGWLSDADLYGDDGLPK
ncbi:MAG TPA: helix-turn-helix domain-containing protein [Hyphomicrobiales bacterium]|nr:helix-turn-helix domain-containing protein [Hyphomicrobiales bacterium]